MSTVFRLTLAKIKAHKFRSIFQAAAITTTVFALAFLLVFSIDVDAMRSDFGDSPFAGFIRKITDALDGSLILIGLIATATVFIYIRMRGEETALFNGKLSSIGATSLQLSAISLGELIILYLLPSYVGALLGTLTADEAARRFITALSIEGGVEGSVSDVLIISLIITVAFFILILIFAAIPHGRGSVIERVKRHNRGAVGERHGYRSSYTFRNMPPEQRLAKKSVEYNKSAYARIAVMLTATLLYVIVAILFFRVFLSAELTFNAELYREALDFIGRLLGFFLGLFALLFVFGGAQLVYMIYLQSKAREQVYKIYRSLGMTERGIKRTALYEYRSVMLYSIIAIIFLAVIILG